MRGKIYLRVAKSSQSGRTFVVEAGSKPNYAPLYDNQGHARPTAAFALEVDIPESRFEAAAQTLASLELDEGDVALAVDVTREGA